MSEQDKQSGTIPLAGAVVLVLLVMAVTLGTTRCLNPYWGMQVLTDLGQLAVLTIAAGGIGHLALRKLLPSGVPRGLAVVTAIGLGLWILGTLVLAAGTAAGGLLKMWLWWPVIILGVAAALWQGRHALEEIALPKRLDGRSLVWALLAAAAVLWLSGATYPPGLQGLANDQYDVLEYHLQVPREYLAAQHIDPLRHNCYSFYPMGTEMLYLLAMVLRGGAYEGMYLANLIHGLYLALAVAAVFFSLRRDDDAHGRFGAVLLGTAPLLLYLSYLAMVELGAVFYLTLALLWMRQWLKAPALKCAAMIGLAIGGACATKYLAVGFVAAPVLAVMVIASFVGQASRLSCAEDDRSVSTEQMLSRKRSDTIGQRVVHVLLSGVLCVAMLSPWLIRNAVYTGNPVFPLATDVFGRGYWSKESQERFQAGHGRANLPPVPPPPIHQDPPKQADRVAGIFTNFLGNEEFTPPLVVLTVIAACLVLAGFPRGGAWERSLLAVLVMQVALWASVTHNMPPRFLAVAIVPMALLCGGMLANLAKVAKNPFSRKSTSSGGPWGLPVAAVILVVVAVVNLVTAYGILTFRLMNSAGELDEGTARAHYYPGEMLAKETRRAAAIDDLPQGSKVALLGSAAVFYLPSNSVYATVFDSDGVRPVPLGSSPRQTLENLRALGVTHMLVNWSEIQRHAEGYGYPSAYVGDMFARTMFDGRRKVVDSDGDRIVEGGKIGTDWLDALGLVTVRHLQQLPFGSASAARPASTPATGSTATPMDLSEFRNDCFHSFVNAKNHSRSLLTEMSLYKLPPEKRGRMR